jgi:hypothetical protein
MALQVSVKPSGRAPDGINLVFALGEAVASVGTVMSIQRSTGGFECRHYLLGFLLGHADIVNPQPTRNMQEGAAGAFSF